MKTLKKSIFILLGCGILIANGSSVFANKSNGINPDLAEDIPTTSSEPIGSEARTAEQNGWEQQNSQNNQGTTAQGMSSQNNSSQETCKGIKLNTNVPFVGKCIETKTGSGTTQLNAFPRLMGGMMRLLMTIILVMSLLMIVVGGVLMTTGGWEKNNYSKGMDMIKKVAYGLALLGASGVILKLINPNFFV